jgi:hypothetical protein
MIPIIDRIHRHDPTKSGRVQVGPLQVLFDLCGITIHIVCLPHESQDNTQQYLLQQNYEQNLAHL